MQSPFTDPNIEFKDDDTIKEVELLDSHSQKLKDINSLYANPKTIMSNILKLYKFLDLREEKQIWEKTEKDVNDDIAKVNYSLELNFAVKKEVAGILTDQERERLVLKKYSVVPVFMDFCFVYYMKMNGNTELGFYTMPSNLLKFKFVCAATGCKDIELNSLFEDVIQNQLMRDVQNKHVPFHLLTDLTPDVLKEKLYNEVLPLMKKIMDKLLRLK
jgi:hypothetical protein